MRKVKGNEKHTSTGSGEPECERRKRAQGEAKTKTEKNRGKEGQRLEDGKGRKLGTQTHRQIAADALGLGLVGGVGGAAEVTAGGGGKEGLAAVVHRAERDRLARLFCLGCVCVYVYVYVSVWV